MVSDLEEVKHPAVGIAEKGKVRAEPLTQPPRDFWLVHADSVYFDASLLDILVVLSELPQLRAAEGSPVSPVEKVQGCRDTLAARAGELHTVLVGERERWHCVADSDRERIAGRA